MRNYIVYYLAELNDECVDLEIPIESDSIENVIDLFKQKVKSYKRILSIIEQSYGK